MGLIYKITNKINNCVYIGKTIRNLEVRIAEHKRDSLKYSGQNIALYNAVQKYGWDNFTIEIVEDNIPQEKIDEKEQYYIDKYNSYIEGYNCTLGGDGGRTSSKLSSTEVMEIISILQDENNLDDFGDIGKRYNIDRSVISNINNGKAWVMDNLNYPLRKYNTTGLTISREKYTKIVHDLVNNSSLNLQDIANKYGLSEGQMTAINQGYSCYNSNNEYYKGIYTKEFPIRKVKNQKIDLSMIFDDILYDILFTKNSMAKIGEKFGIAGNTLQYIQSGKRQKELTYKYIVPLRNNIEENQKIFYTLHDKEVV